MGLGVWVPIITVIKGNKPGERSQLETTGFVFRGASSEGSWCLRVLGPPFEIVCITRPRVSLLDHISPPCKHQTRNQVGLARIFRRGVDWTWSSFPLRSG